VFSEPWHDLVVVGGGEPSLRVSTGEERKRVVTKHHSMVMTEVLAPPQLSSQSHSSLVGYLDSLTFNAPYYAIALLSNW
jgi:hypothetical protein